MAGAPGPARAIPDRVPLSERRGQHLVPVNEHLWLLVQRQARYRFAKFPSPAASSWMHDKYKQMGGRFRDTKNEKDAELAKKTEEHKSPRQKKDEKTLKEQEQREMSLKQIHHRKKSKKKKK